MKDIILTIDSNKNVGSDVYLMRLVGDLSEIKNPGEFVNIKLPGYYLRRPISVCDFSKTHVDILYKILGLGTKDMSTYKEGEKLQVLVGLGNGFNIKKNLTNILLVAGGIGIAPLICLAKKYNEIGIKPTLVYGAATKKDLIVIDELNDLVNLKICTDDGSFGYKGNTVQYIKDNKLNFDFYHACGPYKMLEFLAKTYSNGEVSLEARMGCGFGACMGCSIKTINGPKRVCKEGPVFMASEVEF